MTTTTSSHPTPAVDQEPAGPITAPGTPLPAGRLSAVRTSMRARRAERAARRGAALAFAAYPATRSAAVLVLPTSENPAA